MALVERVGALLAPQGALAERWPRFERRPGQVRMALDVARVLEQGGVLQAEAPTGVGKSLAYMLPALLFASERDACVVVATATKSLQDQLCERDVPRLAAVLGLEVPVARLKGKANYLCPRLLQGARARGEEERALLEDLRAWAAQEEEADLDAFPARDPEAFRRVRGRIATDPIACSGTQCRRGKECFWVRARRRAAAARVVVVNHALLGISGQAEGLLPEHQVLIVDEAHRLEGMLLGQMERSISRHRFEEGFEAVGGPRSTRGLAARARRAALPLLEAESRRRVEQLVAELQERRTPAQRDVEAFFARVEPRGDRHELYGARERYRAAEELLGRDLEALERILVQAEGFSRGLGSLARELDRAGTRGGVTLNLVAELEQRSMRWQALADDARDLGLAESSGWVYWRSANRRGVELRGSPVSVGDFARRNLFTRPAAVILTSATLSAGEEFSFIAGRLGLTEEPGSAIQSSRYDSPFPLAQQVRVFVYGGQGGEARTVAEVVSAMARSASRNMLVLFTAHERLRVAREQLRETLPSGARLLAQEWDGSAQAVSERFRRSRGAVLLGVQSLWEGVDFPGEELEVLVMAKLPFSVPDEPLVAARAERLRAENRDPFREDAIPEAVLRFRQGVGRLIRRADDRGVLVVCDPRLMSASYRAPFQAALPVTCEWVGDAGELAARAESFLAERAVGAEERA